jgi:hypothetical protein
LVSLLSTLFIVWDATTSGPSAIGKFLRWRRHDRQDYPLLVASGL